MGKNEVFQTAAGLHEILNIIKEWPCPMQHTLSMASF